MAIHLLAALVLPWACAVLAIILGKRAGVGIAVICALSQAGLTLLAGPGDQFRVGGVTLAVTGVAPFFLIIFLAAMVTVCTFAEDANDLFVAGALLIDGAVTGVALLDNPFVASLFLQLGGVLAVFLIPRRFDQPIVASSALKYLTLTVVSAVTLLAAFSLIETYRLGGQNQALAQLILALLTIGIGLRIAAFPYHLWLPDFGETAPPATVALVTAVVDVSAFALLIKTFESSPWLIVDDRNRVVLAAGCAIGALLAALLASQQTDLRRIVGYSISAQMGIAGFGIVMASKMSLPAGMFSLVAMVVATVLAWLVVEQITLRVGPIALGTVRGLRAQLPVSGLGLLVAGLTIGGLPLLAGFPGSWMIWGAATSIAPVWPILLIIAQFLLLFSFLRAYRSLFLGPLIPDLLKVESRSANSGIVMLSMLSLLLGVLPAPFLTAFSSAVGGLPFLK